MFAWLYNLIIGNFCSHNWEIFKEVELFSDEDAKLPSGHRYHLRCTKCGNIKFKKSY